MVNWQGVDVSQIGIGVVEEEIVAKTEKWEEVEEEIAALYERAINSEYEVKRSRPDRGGRSKCYIRRRRR